MPPKRGSRGRFVSQGKGRGKGVSVTMEIRGHKGMAKALRKLASTAKREIRKELPRLAIGIMMGAAGKTPVKSGALIGSAFVGKPYTKRGRVGIRAGYQEGYAPAVHEGYHGGKKYPNLPKNNWFREALEEYEPKYLPEMRAIIVRAFRKALEAKGKAGLY